MPLLFILDVLDLFYLDLSVNISFKLNIAIAPIAVPFTVYWHSPKTSLITSVIESSNDIEKCLNLHTSKIQEVVSLSTYNVPKSKDYTHPAGVKNSNNHRNRLRKKYHSDFCITDYYKQTLMLNYSTYERFQKFTVIAIFISDELRRRSKHTRKILVKILYSHHSRFLVLLE